VGLAKPVRLCQGRDIQLVLPQEIPLQIDGEPTMLQAETTMHITWHGETPVLLASDKSAQTQTLAAVQQVLATAYSRGLLSDYQFAQLANEFQKRF
ncbi:putative diacylglycerol kinase, partial [Toxoplasma gondii TgCatPRC2]